MSDEQYTPDEERDYKFEMSRLLHEIGPKVLDHWREILTGGGNRNVTVKCASCGKGTQTSVPVADVQQQRLILTFLQEQLANDPGGTEPRARQLIRDTREMTDAELAEVIAALEADLADESPARRELAAMIDRMTDEQVAEQIEAWRHFWKAHPSAE